MTEPAQTNVITNDIETQDPNSSMPTLFRHMKRESWGLGILQSVMDDRIQMQFQDGRNRSFKKGYYPLLDAVDRPMNIAAGIVDALQSMMPEDDRPELNLYSAAPSASAAPPRAPTMKLTFG